MHEHSGIRLALIYPVRPSGSTLASQTPPSQMVRPFSPTTSQEGPGQGIRGKQSSGSLPTLHAAPAISSAEHDLAPPCGSLARSCHLVCQPRSTDTVQTPVYKDRISETGYLQAPVSHGQTWKWTPRERVLLMVYPLILSVPSNPITPCPPAIARHRRECLQAPTPRPTISPIVHIRPSTTTRATRHLAELTRPQAD